MTVACAELVAATAFSFLRGASQPSDMVAQAHALGLAAIGIADRNSVAGVVRAHAALKHAPEHARAELREARQKAGLSPVLSAREEADCVPALRLVLGARLVFADGTPDIVAYPASRRGWGRLTRLLTTGNRRARKGGCILRIGDLIDHLGDLMLIVMEETSFAAHEVEELAPTEPAPPVAAGAVPLLRLVVPADDPVAPPPPTLAGILALLADKAPGCVWLGATPRHRGDDARRLARLARTAAQAGVPMLATGDVLYACPAARPLHDVVTCIRLGTTLDAAGRGLAPNAERHLKPPEEMARLFRHHPDAITETLRLAARIDFTLDQLAYDYPHEPVPAGWEAQDWLEHLVWEAALDRFDGRVPERMLALLYEEFHLIRDRRYAHYFLTVHDIVRFARSCDPPILCQGRGSAANSVVCFLLGITSVDPMRYDLLFSRFVSAERNEPPDIDVDFEHERREEVMQYIYRRYGRERAGIAATVIHYRPRSTVREVGKVLGFSEDVTTRITSTVWGSYASRMEEDRFHETGFSLDDPAMQRMKWLVEQLLEFPRHLSQHVGGFVLTHDRLDETVPIHNGAMPGRTFIEWDKDDIDELGLMKVDILALGMLTCIQKSFDLMRRHGLGDHTLEVDLGADDPAVYRMLERGDSIGVFQVESRAQMNMLPRLRPRELYDLVIQVAIVRPGPIQGDMVHPYLRRRSGVETVEWPSPSPRHGPPDELKQVLGKTLGVPLFQEQAMKLAIVAARFSPEDANRLRRAMATFRHVGHMDRFEEKMVEGMVRRGYDRDFAHRCYRQIEGFGSYGFPESHALSFARLVYVSSWIKCHQPAVFTCALLNSQPMGFYAPAQLVRDAREHGVDVRPIDINASDWDNRLEPDGAGHAIRLGFRQMDGFRQGWADALVVARETGRFTGVEDLARRAGLAAPALRMLADADGFGSVGLGRRQALWETRRTPATELPLFAAARARELGEEADTPLPAMGAGEEVATDYQTLRLSLKDHPMRFVRDLLSDEGGASSADVAAARPGARIRTAGIVLVRQRPGNGNAIFVTIEDETGVTNIVLWARRFERFRREVMAARLMQVAGEVQRSPEGIVHLMADHVEDRSNLLALLDNPDLKPQLSRADSFWRPLHVRHPRDVRVLPRSRDFH